MTKTAMNGNGLLTPAGNRLRWLRVLIFYLIAVGLAAAARFLWHANDVTANWPSLATMHWHLISGAGPFVGAMVVWIVFRPHRFKSFGGTNALCSWAMLAVPATTMGVMGVSNPYEINPHLFGFYLGVWIATYAVLEETGWRGYLQDEFRDVAPLLRYTIVGLFWYPWHFTFLQHHSLTTELAIVCLLVLASIGIGWIADRTESILAAASLHMSANILGLTAFFSVFIPSSSTRLIIVGICVSVWVVLLRIWRRKMQGRPDPDAIAA